jgi:hypothetical protein
VGGEDALTRLVQGREGDRRYRTLSSAFKIRLEQAGM